MSGTSLDAVDVALIRTDGERLLDYGPAFERPYTQAERAVLRAAVDAARAWAWQGDEPVAAFRAAEAVLLDTHRDALARVGGPKPVLLGVHGQTVLHRAPKDGLRGATRQIFDAHTLARLTGVPVWFDFRTADVEAGGQGAPLAPVYHRALLDRSVIGSGVVLNLGGVANLTFAGRGGELIAFDCGPANGPIDEWVEGHGAGVRDDGGRLARAGRAHEAVLADVLDWPFFDAAPPKSLDRYDFSASLVRGLSLEDGAATLTELAARAVARGLDLLPEWPERVVACGGGRHNPTLMAALNRVCGCPVVPAEAMGWRGDSIEAEAFAFLAARSARGLPLGYPATTGVPVPMTGGRLAHVLPA
jgi:anhydro-N-acetylmuramic acid kinase